MEQPSSDSSSWTASRSAPVMEQPSFDSPSWTASPSVPVMEQHSCTMLDRTNTPPVNVELYPFTSHNQTIALESPYSSAVSDSSDPKYKSVRQEKYPSSTDFSKTLSPSHKLEIHSNNSTYICSRHPKKNRRNKVEKQSVNSESGNRNNGSIYAYSPKQRKILTLSEADMETKSEKQLTNSTRRNFRKPVEDSLDELTDIEDSENISEISETMSLFPFVCGLCFEKYDKIAEYFIHLKLQHEEQTEKYLHICDKDVKMKENALFTCGVCAIAFPSLCSLHVHVTDIEHLSDFHYDAENRTILPPQRNASFRKSRSIDENQIIWSASKKDIWNRIIFHESLEPITKMNRKYIADKSKIPHSGLTVNKLVRNSCKIKTEPDGYINDKEDTVDDYTVTDNEKSDEDFKEDQYDSDATIIDDVADEADTEMTDNTITGTTKHEGDSETIVKNDTNEHINYVDQWRRKYQRYLDQKQRRLRYLVKSDDDVDTDDENDNNDVGINDENYDDNVDDRTDAAMEETNTEDPDTDRDESDEAVQEVTGRLKRPRKRNRTVTKEPKYKPSLRYENRASSISQQMVPCETCGALVKRKNLRSHRIQHQDIRNYECELCGLKVKTITLLRTHKQNVHAEANSIVCDICGKGFKNKHYLKQHQYVHTSERNLPCPKCPLVFKSKKCLRIHQLCHTESKTHQCLQCDRSFKRLEELRTHNKYVHSDVRNKVCSYCGKAFKTMECVKKHEKTHLPHKHFCSVCGKSFAQSYNMKLHMKVHSSE